MSDKVNLPDITQEKNLLFDFYESLLTDKQREVYTMYYAEDYSLAEIGNMLNITPQAVADILKRTNTWLTNYENKLGLVQKFETQKKIIKELLAILEEHNPELVEKIHSMLKQMVL